MNRKVTLVSYINTLPYIDILKDNSAFSLDLKIPSLCASAYESGDADIALVPVAAVQKLKRSFTIIDKFGIGGDGPVRTVKLLSKVPLNKISSIGLDIQSTSSRKLIQILASKFWKIKPHYKDFNNQDSEEESILAIGDKVFDLESNFDFHYDLSDEWKKFTGLPFAFAIWIISDKLSIAEKNFFLEILNTVEQGVKNVVTSYRGKHANGEIASYLNTHIKYRFDDRYRESIELFHSYGL